MKNKENKIPTMEELHVLYPSKTDEEIGDIEYPSEEEEENLDTSFLLEPWEERYYDEDGNFYPDGYKDEDGNIIEGAKKQ